MHPVAAFIQPLLGHPAWQVRRSTGSFVLMDYGEPRLVVHEPKLRPLLLPGAPSRTLRRRAYVHGDWHFRVTYCEWTLRLGGVPVAHSASGHTTMDRALRVLDGQLLRAVGIGPDDGRTTFHFDLGCTLLTRPAPPGTYGREPAEQWVIGSPDGRYLTVREDGTYSLAGGDATEDDEIRLPITAPLNVRE